jgi:hypothetical protein
MLVIVELVLVQELVSVEQLVAVMVRQAMNPHPFHQALVVVLVEVMAALLVLMLLKQLSIVPILTRMALLVLENSTILLKVAYKRLIFSFSHISLLYLF